MRESATLSIICAARGQGNDGDAGRPARFRLIRLLVNRMTDGFMVTSVVVLGALAVCLIGRWLDGRIALRLQPWTAAAVFARLGRVLLSRLDRPARGEGVLRVRGVLIALFPLFPALAVYGLQAALRVSPLSPFLWLFECLLFVWSCPSWQAPWQPGMEGCLGDDEVTAFLAGPVAAVFAYALAGVAGLIFLRALLSFWQVAEHAEPPPSRAFVQTPARLSMALLVLPDILSALLIVLAMAITGVPGGMAGLRHGGLLAEAGGGRVLPGALTRRLASAVSDSAIGRSVAMVAHLLLLALAAVAVMLAYV